MEEQPVEENMSQCSVGSSNVSAPDFEVVDTVDNSPKLNVGNDGDSNDLACELNEILEPLNLDKIMLNSSSHGVRDVLKDNSEVVNYSGVTYLGSAAAMNPNSLAECRSNIKMLREQSKVPIAVLLSVPRRPDGIVNLYDPITNLSILSFHLSRVEFCTRGHDGTAERQSLAFTCSRGDSHSYQCHAFSCETLPAAKKIIDSFMYVFKLELPISTITNGEYEQISSRFRIELDISEICDSSSGVKTPVHRDRHVFKLRRNKLKQLTILVEAMAPSSEFLVEKCFGLLLSEGRDVRQSEMTLIEINSMGFENEKIYKIVCNWDPTDPSFKILNTINSKESRVFFTIAVDLILTSVAEPVRFIVESKAKIYGEHEKFWSLIDSTPHYELFTLQFVKVLPELNANSNSNNSTDEHLLAGQLTPHSSIDTHSPSAIKDSTSSSSSPEAVSLSTVLLDGGEESSPPVVHPPPATSPTCYSLHSIRSQSQLDRLKASRHLAITPTKSTSRVHIDAPVEDSDNDEPLLSGSGVVSREISDVTLTRWDKTIVDWQISIKNNTNPNVPKVKPKDIQGMVRRGVPECYRGAVWPLLSFVYLDKDVMEETYRNLCIKESPCDHIIKSDIHRTFPAHNFFKEAGGSGQESLFRICKAYSLYDAEVGYCQGLSFLVASLLLHMPEEQAFCVMVKIMNDYQMRDVYKNGLESLHLRIYQLERLLQDQLPELSGHFVKINLEAHMFASQWFLTLFTAKFPLYMVFHILDLFLSEGSNVIFQVAVALLKYSSGDLMKQDFEGALKYFRVNLPKLFKTELAASNFLYSATQIKISRKKMNRYDKDFRAMRELQALQEDPVDQLMRLNKAKQDTILRLEQENDDLAHQLVTSKIDLRSQLDMMEDQCENLSSDLVMSKSQIYDSDEERHRLYNELQQLKFICRNELDAMEDKDKKNTVIISDYKKICSKLSSRIEMQQTNNDRMLSNIKSFVSKCDACKLTLLTADSRRWSAAVTDPLGITDSMDRDTNPVRIRELELELAQTKLALVESQVQHQELTHKLTGLNSKIRDEAAAHKNSWLSKTLTSIKEKAASSSLPLSPSTPKLLVSMDKR